MAEPVKLHPNKPDVVHFPCPSCGRDCILEPKFHTEGAARGVRHGHGVAHSLPACRTYKTMDHTDFLKLAAWEVPVLRDDPHVSVKQPDPEPMIFSDGARARVRTPEELGQLEAERHLREVEVTKAEGIELGRMRDKLRSEEPTMPPPRPRQERRRLGVVVGLAALLLLAAVVAVVLRLR